MRTDGVFRVHELKIKGWNYKDTLTLIPFGDVHWDSPGHCSDKWNEFLIRGREAARKGNVLFLGMGDYMDGYSTSERAVMGSGQLHESSHKRHEAEGRARVKNLAKELSFMRGYIDGESSYVVDMALPPASLGWVEFTIKMHLEQESRKLKKASRRQSLGLDITGHS